MKNEKRFHRMTNAIAPATENAKFDRTCKGGATTNASIDPHAFNREMEDMERHKPMEHETYIGDHYHVVR